MNLFKNFYIFFCCCVLLSCTHLKKHDNFIFKENKNFQKNKILAIVGNKNITEKEFNIELEKFNEKNISKKILNEYFNNFVEYNTILQISQNMNFDKSETYLQKVKDFKIELLINFFNEYIKEKIVIPDNIKLNEYYNKNKNRFKENFKLGLKNILCESETDALKIKNQFKKNKNFNEIQKKFNSSAIIFSDLGFISKGLIDSQLEKEAFKLKPNQISNIIKTRLGYHILFCYSIQPNKYIPFEKVKKILFKEIVENQYTKILNKILKDFKKNNPYSINKFNLDNFINKYGK